MKKFLNSRILRLETFVIFFTSLIALFALYLSYQHDAILLFNDGNAHLNTARRVIDNVTPGFVQLGSVWLPFFHILLIPFVLSDFLWKTGIAGSIVNGISFILSGWLLFKLVDYITQNKWNGVISTLLFATNANMLYMQTTPMDEPVLIVTSLASIYFICRWARENSLNYLIYSAFFIFLASLTRYDGWSLFIAIGTYIIYISLFIRHKGKGGKEGPLMIFIFLGGFGIVLWFLYNIAIFNDPLYFASGEYSAHAQQAILLTHKVLPTFHNLGLDFLTYGMAVLLNVGLLSSILMIFGIIHYLYKNFNKPEEWGALLLLVVFVFNIAALYLGHSVIWLPNISPFLNTYFNVRYGVLMIPAAAFFVGYLASAGRFIRFTLFICILFQGLVFLQPSLLPAFGGIGGITTMKDTVSSVSEPTKHASSYLSSHYHGGYILVSSASEDSFIFHTKVPLKNYITEGTGSYWKKSLQRPEEYATWIVFFVNRSDRVGRIVGQKNNLSRFFNRRYLDNTFEIWEKK